MIALIATLLGAAYLAALAFIILAMLTLGVSECIAVATDDTQGNTWNR